MAKAQAGDTVTFHYTGTLADGSVFDSSEGREPLGCTLGEGQIIPGLDTALQGLEAGEKTTVTIPADEAYGAHDPRQVQEVPRSEIPDEIPLAVGLQLQARTPDGQAVPLVVTAVAEDTVTLDANHPLAGKDLTFAVEMVSVG
ncbi:MAG: FKBP-type peptidyl-prolyl cis-trans isomerase [Rubricella sp.]